jgi:hypothetical protein
VVKGSVWLESVEGGRWKNDHGRREREACVEGVEGMEGMEGMEEGVEGVEGVKSQYARLLSH